MEPELHRGFLAASKRVHRPAAQIVRDLMRAYLAQRKEPNNETLAAMEAIEQGDVNTYATVDDFYHKIRICWSRANSTPRAPLKRKLNFQNAVAKIPESCAPSSISYYIAVLYRAHSVIIPRRGHAKAIETYIMNMIRFESTTQSIKTGSCLAPALTQSS